MKSRLFSNPARLRQVTEGCKIAGLSLLLCLVTLVRPAAASSDAPAWMRAVANAPLPEHDEKTDAVLLYSETNVTVISTDKIKTQERRVYKILRPSGREYGFVYAYFDANQKITSIRGWCIPNQGKDYEVKDKDAIEQGSPVDGGYLVLDVRRKVLQIPAAEPGAVIGYEYELEERPLFFQDTWDVQHVTPTRESHYSLQLPSGWEYNAQWLNHSEIKPTEAGSNLWRWSVSDVKGIRHEEEMPPFAGVAAQMIITFFPSGGRSATSFSSWHDMGTWYTGLITTRIDTSPQIKDKTTQLTATSKSQLEQMRAIAQYLQQSVRYVAIELGIGGWQPHAASDVFAKSYGDCKDKVTLMMAMLREIGVTTYYVVINASRGAVSADTPAHISAFNHVILAIKLPDGINDSSLIATIKDPKLGRLLFFDPTNEVTPFGQIGGYLQGNYGLLVTPEGGELVELPMQPSNTNGITRTATLTLQPNGTLKGEVREVRVGDRARSERQLIRTAPTEQDRAKRIEKLLANSLSNFRLTKLTISNIAHTNQPFEYDYSFEAESYARDAGGLLLLRPRAVGTKGSGLLETKEARVFPIEFSGPAKDTDVFEITLPSGYEVEELPQPVDADYSFASYHAKSEAKGNTVRYTRTFEVKEVSVPVSQADELKKFYRMIATDERSMAVLRPVASASK